MNQPIHAMPGDSCPAGHHVVSKLDAIDAALRDLLVESGPSNIRFLGIVPYVNPLYPSVRIGSSVFFSFLANSSSSSKAYARIVDFAVNTLVNVHVTND
jgi:hypothetical protein